MPNGVESTGVINSSQSEDVEVEIDEREEVDEIEDLVEKPLGLELEVSSYSASELQFIKVLAPQSNEEKEVVGERHQVVWGVPGSLSILVMGSSVHPPDARVSSNHSPRTSRYSSTSSSWHSKSSCSIGMIPVERP